MRYTNEIFCHAEHWAVSLTWIWRKWVKAAKMEQINHAKICLYLFCLVSTKVDTGRAGPGLTGRPNGLAPNTPLDSYFYELIFSMKYAYSKEFDAYHLQFSTWITTCKISCVSEIPFVTFLFKNLKETFFDIIFTYLT